MEKKCKVNKTQKPRKVSEVRKGLKHLGVKDNFKEITKGYNPSLLESCGFTQKGKVKTFVKLLCEEFTSLCPVTGQPDFATIDIVYVPKDKIVESKSLKLYLGSFRNQGHFHEDIIQTICNDLVELLNPIYLEVYGNFFVRGGIAIHPYSKYGSLKGIALPLKGF